MRASSRTTVTGVVCSQQLTGASAPRKHFIYSGWSCPCCASERPSSHGLCAPSPYLGGELRTEGLCRAPAGSSAVYAQLEGAPDVHQVETGPATVSLAAPWGTSTPHAVRGFGSKLISGWTRMVPRASFEDTVTGCGMSPRNSRAEPLYLRFFLNNFGRWQRHFLKE